MRSLLQNTAFWRVAREVKRAILPAWLDSALPDEQCRGAVAVIDPPVAADPNRLIPWRVLVLNRSGVAWATSGAMPVRLTFRWHTHAGEPFGEPIHVPLPNPAYPGEPLEFFAPVATPGFVGDYLLEVRLEQGGSGRPVGEPHRVAVPVIGSRTTDIDYHEVYRTANLKDNHWWVVGAYHTREEYEQSQADRRGMLITEAGLTPDSRVLDVGCGTGQMAAALWDYLSPLGRYCGTDIGREAIDFCRKMYRRPNFAFRQGGMTSVPFHPDDGPFDLAIFFSVFTHTYSDESALLLAEVNRLLAPDGVVVADVIVSPLVERGSGNRGQMVVNRDHFERLAAAVGFGRPAVIGRWPWNPHAERLMYRLSRRD